MLSRLLQINALRVKQPESVDAGKSFGNSFLQLRFHQESLGAYTRIYRPSIKAIYSLYICTFTELDFYHIEYDYKLSQLQGSLVKQGALTLMEHLVPHHFQYIDILC